MHKKLEGVCEQLVKQLKSEGFLTYGFVYKILGIKMPNNSYRYKFYCGDRNLWERYLKIEIENKKKSMKGMLANANGFKEQHEEANRSYNHWNHVFNVSASDLSKLQYEIERKRIDAAQASGCKDKWEKESERFIDLYNRETKKAHDLMIDIYEMRELLK